MLGTEGFLRAAHGFGDGIDLCVHDIFVVGLHEHPEVPDRRSHQFSLSLR